MSMPTITVIIENGPEQYEEQEVEISCPTATQDETLNEANKEAAITLMDPQTSLISDVETVVTLT